MAIETLLWREASIARDVDRFLAQVGGSVLDAVDASAAIVRLLERDHLDTVASIRRGAVGVARPTKPRTELSAAAAARVTSWIAAGELARSTAPVAKDLLRGVADPADGQWWLVPLAAHSDALGVLMISADHELDARKLAAISEPIAAVLATEHSRRELQQLREAAEAAKDAALAKLQVRDIGLAVVGAETGLSEVMRQVEQVAP